MDTDPSAFITKVALTLIDTRIIIAGIVGWRLALHVRGSFAVQYDVYVI